MSERNKRECLYVSFRLFATQEFAVSDLFISLYKYTGIPATEVAWRSTGEDACNLPIYQDDADRRRQCMDIT